MAPSLMVRQPRPHQEFPAGTDFLVSGTAVGTGGTEPHPIDAVTVQLDQEPRLEATLAALPPPPRNRSFAVAFSATLRLTTPGPHQIEVTATDDLGRSITEHVVVDTPGTMHCEAGVAWSNYPSTLSLVPYSTCVPDSLSAVVGIVREAEAGGKHVHAFGSKWSFSDCAVTTDYVIDTRQLYREVQTVQRALRPGQSSRVYHVEAGISIRSLYNNLNRLGLALETMGGASGQTLAGAISTGTHGGDKLLAPLADSVLAIHLVGAGGTQFWIEPSPGITDPGLLKTFVVPDIDPLNIIYDDATFDACLVSLGCMGVIYAIVLRVREPYDLLETTVETTWQDFRENTSTYLNDPGTRFLQVLLNPYADSNNENLCLVTTRSEADVTGPAQRPRGDLEAAFRSMVDSFDIHAKLRLSDLGVFDADGLPQQERVAKIIQGVLAYTPDQRPVMTAHYGNLLRAYWPTGTFQGSSYSVMDLGYGQVPPASQPGYSVELSFEAMLGDGRLGFADFVDAVIARVRNATWTFLAGYISLRFTGPTRACLGMQQWGRTCAVEISAVQGVQRLAELLSGFLDLGLKSGGLPHWGQQLDLRPSHGSVYPRYAQWRQIYGRMSNSFATRTFENGLSYRWNLTMANDAQFVSQTVPQVMEAGQSQRVAVTMRNTGISTWSRSGAYRLGSQGPQDNTRWGIGRVEVPADVAPGATVAFEFSITAPERHGTFFFEWRMVQESVEWFGVATPLVAIRVNPLPTPTTVPDVTEMTSARATNVIRAAELEPRYSGPRPTGADVWVSAQSPQGGTLVARGSTVTLTLRAGPPR